MNPTLKKTLIIALAIIIPCGIVGLVAWKAFKKDDSDDPSSPKTTEQQSSEFPLQYNPNKKSELVKQLQKKLNDKLAALETPVARPKDSKGSTITKLTTDGYFGDKTRIVVQFFLNTETVTKEQFESL